MLQTLVLELRKCPSEPIRHACSVRFLGDAFRIDADWSVHPPRKELDMTAQQIGAALR